MNIRFILSALALSLYLNTLATTEIHRIKEVAQYICNKHTLIVFDIDNTLLMPHTDLGSDQWFTHLMQQRMSSGMDRKTALLHVLPLYFHVHLNIDLTPTEPSISDELAALAKQCDHIICLTARSQELVQRTIDQLTHHNIQFTIPGTANSKLSLDHPCSYDNGILFCSANDKGAVLRTFLQHIGYTPEAIIFVDDKESCINSVERAAHHMNIPFIGLRYAGCDHRVKAFDSAATEQELHTFLAQYPPTAQPQQQDSHA